MPRRPRTLASAVMALVLAAPVFAQHAPPAERVIRMNGAAPTAAGTQASLRFAIYDAETGGTQLWQETQTVTVDQTGQYTVFLGAMAALYGGGLVAWLYGGVDPEAFLLRLRDAISINHFVVGLIKAPVMAAVIGIVA